MTKTAKLINLWFDRIIRDAESGTLNWKAMALADLDVDTVMRDVLLDALEVMVDLQIGRVEIDELQVPGSQGAIIKGLASMGVPHC